MYQKEYEAQVTSVLRRITIDSTRLSVAVTPFARGSKKLIVSAKVAPEPPSARPFQAGQKGATASRVNRALYGLYEVSALRRIDLIMYI
jgi:hypothetical protein